MKKIMMIVCMMTVTMCTFAQFQQRNHSKGNTTFSQGVVKHSKKSTNNPQNSNKVVSNEEGHSAGTFETAYAGCFGYVIPTLGDGYKNGFSCSMSLDFGARYNITDDAYAEGLIGYKWVILSAEPENSKVLKSSSSTIHNISIPFHLGYQITDKSSIFVGPRIDIPVSATGRYDGKDYDLDVPTTALIECGINIGCVRLQYDYSPAKSNKYSLIAIGVTL